MFAAELDIFGGKMFSKLVPLTAGIAAFVLPYAAAGAPILYNGSQQIGLITATYSVLTDGTFGSNLNSSNILDFSFTLSSGIYSVSFTKANSYTSGIYSASEISLYSINAFASPTSSEPIQFEKTNSSVSYGNFVRFYSDRTEARIDLGASDIDQSVSVNNNVSFADNLQATSSAVPEPATWGMMIVGLGAIGFAMRRRARASEAEFSDRLRRIAAGEIS